MLTLTVIQIHFNSQPREGGWMISRYCHRYCCLFQLTAARRRLGLYNFGINTALIYFNSQPREGGWTVIVNKINNSYISTHSRAKAAGVNQ